MCGAKRDVRLVPIADIAVASYPAVEPLCCSELNLETPRGVPCPERKLVLPASEEIDWRQVWLTNAMIDSGKLEPPKIARYKMQTRKDTLTRRLHRLRRMRAVLGPR